VHSPYRLIAVLLHINMIGREGWKQRICQLPAWVTQHYWYTNQGPWQHRHSVPHWRHYLRQWVHFTMGSIHTTSGRDHFTSPLHDCEVYNLLSSFPPWNWNHSFPLQVFQKSPVIDTSLLCLIQWESWTRLAQQWVILQWNRLWRGVWCVSWDHVLYAYRKQSKLLVCSATQSIIFEHCWIANS